MKKGMCCGFFSKGKKGACGGGSTCNPVYGLGMLGAVVYYWQTSPDFGDKIVGIIKALLWPAFLVYSVLEKLAM